ncbi:hypothetical protein V1478_013714 [Vespula squamosa]|uniref:Uncharacterized protein n=1 Tax=Vespula squamosa TaxID=30214 RepID=A0ABD2A5X5_VESSQ
MVMRLYNSFCISSYHVSTRPIKIEVSDLTSTQIIIGQSDNNRAHTNSRYFLAYSIEILRFNRGILRFMEIARNEKCLQGKSILSTHLIVMIVGCT